VGEGKAISIHVYGADIGKLGSSINRTFDYLPILSSPETPGVSTGIDRACRELLRATSPNDIEPPSRGCQELCMLMVVVYEADDGDEEGAKIHK
jgi:hypothetical protein